MVILFFLEGFETTATTTTAAIIELARNVELQEKLRQQIVAACPPGEDITDEALNSVPLLHNAFIGKRSQTSFLRCSGAYTLLQNT